MISFFLFVCLVFSIANSDPIHGTITSPFADEPRKLSIIAYSRHGLAVDLSPVIYDASFTLHCLGISDGDYVLHVLGSEREDYDPQFVRIVNGRIQIVENRRDPLTLPDSPNADVKNTTMYLSFAPTRKTNYKREKEPWSLTYLWAMRIRFLQLAAVVFVVWFPQFIRSLPKEVRDELMGETDDDVGDTTAMFQALSGCKESGQSESIPSSSSKR